MEFLVVLLVSVVMAFVAHEGAKYANDKVPKLNLSPNWFAVIAFLFGVPGMLTLLVYALLKYMVKK
jgi:divalent metal cation (Fe/Co/Zn/Cd) transporter